MGMVAVAVTLAGIKEDFVKERCWRTMFNTSRHISLVIRKKT